MEELRQKLKLFNYRPLVLVFLSIVGGILVCNFISRNTYVTVVSLVLAVGVLIFYSILHKKYKYLIIALIGFVLGCASFAIFTNTRQHKQVDLSGQYVEGVVTSITTRDTRLDLIVENATIEGEEAEYNLVVYYYNTYQDGYINLEKGARIGFTINSVKEVNYYYEDNVPNTYYLANNVGAIVKTYEVNLLGTQRTVRDNLLNRIRENLRLGLNNLNVEMIFSAMFGDKTYLNEDLYSAYKTAGVAHLLAVSGLHVGLVVAIINWLMKKMRIKGWWRIATVALLLFGYAYLCDFSYSIIRASIMSIVLLMASQLFSEYDLLSSICFAGCLILIIEPIALFDVSAQLSFGCVFGIAMLTPIFSRWLKKVPINKALKDSLCISFSTILATCVIMAYYFGGFQPIGLLSNIIILPIFSVLFTIAFVLAILSLIMPFVAYALNLVNPLFEWLNWAIIFIGNHAKGFSTHAVNYFTVLMFFVWMTFASKYNLSKGFTKVALAGSCACLVALQIAMVF